MAQRKNWRNDEILLGSIGFAALVTTTTIYIILTNYLGEQLANFFVDNFSLPYRAIFPTYFAIENPRMMVDAIKFALCASFNIFGIIASIYAWESRKSN